MASLRFGDQASLGSGYAGLGSGREEARPYRHSTPAGGPVGAPRRIASESIFRKERCWTAGGRVGDRVKNTPTTPLAHVKLNWPRSQFSAITGPKPVQSPSSFFSF